MRNDDLIAEEEFKAKRSSCLVADQIGIGVLRMAHLGTWRIPRNYKINSKTGEFQARQDIRFEYQSSLPQIPATSSLIVSLGHLMLKVWPSPARLRARASQTLHLWLNLTVDSDDF